MTAGFFTELDVRERRDGRKQLLAPLVFSSVKFGGQVVVPAGFVSDYASTPRITWSVFPKDGPAKWAAVVHDAAYNAATTTEDGTQQHWVKRFADDLFDEALRATGVTGLRRGLMVAAVRKFGGRVYGGLGAPLNMAQGAARAANEVEA